MSSIVLFCKHRLSLLDRMHSSCTNQEFVQQKSEQLVKAVLDKQHSTKNMQVEEAAEVSDLLETCKGLSPTDKSKCVTALMAVATDDSLGRDFGAQPTKYLGNGAKPYEKYLQQVEEGDYPKYQVHNYIHHYITKDGWTQAADGAKPMQLRVAPLVRAMHRCGWVRYSEPQLAEVVGTLGPLGVDTTGESGLAILHHLKYGLSLVQKKMEMPGLSLLVWEFPANPNELPEPWKTKAQEDGELVVSPFTDTELTFHRVRTPCRRSHKDVQANRSCSGGWRRLSLQDMPTPQHGAQPNAMWHPMQNQMANAWGCQGWPQLTYGAQHQPGQQFAPPQAPGEIALTLFPNGHNRNTLPGTEGSVPGMGGSVPGTEGSAPDSQGSVPGTEGSAQSAPRPAPAEQPQSQSQLVGWGLAPNSVPAIEDRKEASPAELPVSLSKTISQTRSVLQEASQARKTEIRDKPGKKGAKPEKAAAKAKAKAAAKGKAKAGAKAKPVTKIWGDKLLLGCSKCRADTVNGCSQCRDPGFGGKRGPASYTPAGKKRR